MSEELARNVYSYDDFCLMPVDVPHGINDAMLYWLDNERVEAIKSQYFTQDHAKVLKSFDDHIVYVNAQNHSSARDEKFITDYPDSGLSLSYYEKKWTRAITIVYPTLTMSGTFNPKTIIGLNALAKNRAIFWVGIKSMQMIVPNSDDKTFINYYLTQRGFVDNYGKWEHPDLWTMFD